MEYRVAFKERIRDNEEKDYLVVYIYNRREDFIKEVDRGRFNKKRVIQTGILEEEILFKANKMDLPLKIIDCKS